jgi:Asp-tRNA(Asn)/Glu-tRNA(Gln) amidotransferase A subunit family amidase
MSSSDLPIIPSVYEPSSVKLNTFHDKLPDFIEGTDTPRDYLERCIETIKVREAHVKAFVVKDLTAARKAADASTLRYKTGRQLSAVDGMPFAVKDLLMTAEFPTELNSPLFAGERHRFDAANVYALKKGGAALIGKTTLPELGSGQPPATRNPFNLDRSPGGSSSGSAAAVGAGMLPIAIGSQGRGSVLRPASFCGNFALKPTFGAIHSGGLLWRSPGYSTLGIHGNSINDCWRTSWQIAQTVGGDPGHPGLFGKPDIKSRKPKRLIRLDTLGWSITENVIKESFENFVQILQEQNVEIISREQDPDIEVFERELLTIPRFQPQLAAWEIQWPALQLRDVGRNQITERLVERFEFGESMTLDAYRDTLKSLEKLRQSFALLRGKADAFITLSAPTLPPLGDNTGDSVYGDPSSCLEAPAWNIPLLMQDNLPIGIQLLGQKYHDYRLGQFGEWMTDHFLSANPLDKSV